jgi:hypothetical protein
MNQAASQIHIQAFLQEEDDHAEDDTARAGHGGASAHCDNVSRMGTRSEPVRVRGEIAQVEGNTLLIKSRDGQNLTVKLADNARIAAMVKASLADIKEGAFIGVSAMPQADGTQKAFAIHIFMDSQRGVVADRHTPWDSRPGSTMTNANVSTTVAGKDGQDLLVKYKDGEKKVIVPPGTPIARYTPGSAADLKVGAKIFIGAAQKQPDASLTAPNVAVGRDIDPPQ